MASQKNVALFDMDGTLCDYIGGMIEELKKLMKPGEQFVDPFLVKDAGQYQYLWNRMDLIKSSEAWWANLGKFTHGFEILEIAKNLGYYCEILTQAPKDNPVALSGKLKWIRKNLDPEIDFTMTRNKSRHYGRILVDDYPGYIIPWLERRPRGLVIMPVNKYNKSFEHPQVIHYTGDNSDEIEEALGSFLIKE